ncbi:MAG TPA: PEP/pyruvate-binding domain-containing protein [Anaerolineae bacterium]|nr:PEP/pyruvate-binding domain-containing protein [Anaerolineae bacterium]
METDEQTTLPLPKVFDIHLQLANYPILSDRIRRRMREEMFARGVIAYEVFEQEVNQKAKLSQQREGLNDPYHQESPDVWERRKNRIRNQLTDFYFAYNLPHRLLTDIIQETIGRKDPDELTMSFNPELAPWDVLFARGRQYEALPPEEQEQFRHHLEEIKVVLIKAMISDQLGFVGIARNHFSIADLDVIRRHRIGRGKIGGKAAGLMLAWTILHSAQAGIGPDLTEHLAVPESFFVGADVFYDFLEINNLLDNLNQKYKSTEQIIADYQTLPDRFAQGKFPQGTIAELTALLAHVAKAPLIVRSSSLLEDNVNTSFAGKYDSIFCPNQGSPEQNLEDLMWAISQVYASALNPDALLYRRQMGLIDYDERMAIIIQKVAGEQHKQFFFPTLAGVGFSRNPFLWTPRLRREEGFVRLVAGLGTRAVDRVPDDYPRMIGLSHPTLRPDLNARQIAHYSQHQMDVVDLAANELRTVPVRDVIDASFPWLRLLASRFSEGVIQSITSTATKVAPDEMVLTMDGVVERTSFVAMLKQMLATLEAAYNCPVDVEFALEFRGTVRKPEPILHLLQCRPQSSSDQGARIEVPNDVPRNDTLFTANYLIPNGIVDRIRYVVYVDPSQYARLAPPSEKLEIARAIGRLNQVLKDERFILIGPGRWGSANLDLGVKVTYADVFNTKMLIELGYSQTGGMPEVSYGTHFFQDLVEARIYPLAVFPDQDGTVFDKRFLAEAPNLLTSLLPSQAASEGVLKVIDVPVVRAGQLLEVIMSSEQSRALGRFKRYE